MGYHFDPSETATRQDLNSTSRCQFEICIPTTATLILNVPSGEATTSENLRVGGDCYFDSSGVTFNFKSSLGTSSFCNTYFSLLTSYFFSGSASYTLTSSFYSFVSSETFSYPFLSISLDIQISFNLSSASYTKNSFNSCGILIGSFNSFYS